MTIFILSYIMSLLNRYNGLCLESVHSSLGTIQRFWEEQAHKASEMK